MTRGLLLAFGVAAFPFCANAADIKGTWLTQEGKARVSMESCGSNVCGKIVWLKEPNDGSGKPLIDGNNQDPRLKTRPIVGIKLTEMSNAGGSWKGRVYNPEDGQTYDGEAQLAGDRLVMKGCALGGAVCDSETWTRYR